MKGMCVRPRVFCVFFTALTVLPATGLAQIHKDSSRTADRPLVSQAEPEEHAGQTKPASTPYEFKIARLGMSIDDFKAATKGDVAQVDSGEQKRTWLGSKTMYAKTKEVQTPLCSDTYANVAPDPDSLATGEVVCDPSPGSANVQLRVVMGQVLLAVRYYFYQGRLYRISLEALPQSFDALVGVFTRKYGPAEPFQPNTYQNGYGAQWTSRNFGWRRGTQMIVLSEGSGNGPGQQFRGKSIGFFLDTSLAPPKAPASPIDF